VRHRRRKRGGCDGAMEAVERAKRKRRDAIEDIFGRGKERSQQKQKEREEEEEEKKSKRLAEARAKDEMKVAMGWQRTSKYKTEGIGAGRRRREKERAWLEKRTERKRGETQELTNCPTLRHAGHQTIRRSRGNEPKKGSGSTKKTSCT